MRIDNKELFKVYRDKGVSHLYHANTVGTSMTFLMPDGMLSRGDVDDNNLFQTSQTSDQGDREYDVWYDIFVDTLDLHSTFSNGNFYGPVTFMFRLECILDERFNFWITKDNPVYWKEELTTQDRYFRNAAELQQKWYLYNRHRMMTTIRKIHSPVLFEYLERIVVDDPQIVIDGASVFQSTYEGIKRTLNGSKRYKGKFFPRKCSASCGCRTRYGMASVPYLRRMFLDWPPNIGTAAELAD